jgi:hypothetical protein
VRSESHPSFTCSSRRSECRLRHKSVHHALSLKKLCKKNWQNTGWQRVVLLLHLRARAAGVSLAALATDLRLHLKFVKSELVRNDSCYCLAQPRQRRARRRKQSFACCTRWVLVWARLPVAHARRQSCMADLKGQALRVRVCKACKAGEVWDADHQCATQACQAGLACMIR